MSPSLRIEWTAEARADLRGLRPFDRPPIRRAIEELAHLAVAETRNRKPLREPIPTLPEATWEVRVERHRIFYCVNHETVLVLRVILKTGTTGESL